MLAHPWNPKACLAYVAIIAPIYHVMVLTVLTLVEQYTFHQTVTNWSEYRRSTQRPACHAAQVALARQLSSVGASLRRARCRDVYKNHARVDSGQTRGGRAMSRRTRRTLRLQFDLALDETTRACGGGVSGHQTYKVVQCSARRDRPLTQHI